MLFILIVYRKRMKICISIKLNFAIHIIYRHHVIHIEFSADNKNIILYYIKYINIPRDPASNNPPTSIKYLIATIISPIADIRDQNYYSVGKAKSAITDRLSGETARSTWITEAPCK